MCWEAIEVDAAPGAKNANIKAAGGPILSVDDARLDDPNDPAMQRRRRVLAVLGRRFPASIKRDGEPAPFDQGAFKDMTGPFFLKPNPGDTCTTVNGVIMGKTGVGANGSWGFGASNNRAWVKAKPGLLPSVGDTFNFVDVDDGMLHHCGIIVQVSLLPGEFWLTADGGQGYPEFLPNWERPPGQVQAAYIVPRTSSCRPNKKGIKMLRLYHYIDKNPDGGYRLSGWVDVGHPSVDFENRGAYDERGTRADYEDFKARIKRVDAAAKKRFA